MGTIREIFENAWRDYVTPGVPASGDHEPVKAEIRAIGGAIERALSASLGNVEVAYATLDELNADLDWPEGATGLVFDDPAPANIDLYVKSGASGAGAWANTGALSALVENLVSPYLVTVAGARQQLSQLLATRLAGPTLPADQSGGDAVTFVDELGRRLASVGADGRFIGAESALDEKRLPRAGLDPEFSSGFVDEAGRPLLALRKASGLIFAPAFEPANGVAYVEGGAVRAFLRDGSDIALSAPGGTHSRVVQTGNTVSFYRAGIDGFDEIVDELLAPLTPLPEGVTRILYVPLYGQSNAGDFGALPLTLEADAPGRSLTFAAGPYLQPGLTSQYAAAPLPLRDIAVFRDMVSRPRSDGTYGETPAPGLGWALAELTGSDTVCLTASLALGGASISILSKGGDPNPALGGAQNYRNVLRSVQRAKVMADLMGVDLVVPAIGWIQGESNHNTAYATYDAAYVALQAAFDTDVRAITGQTETVLLAAHQTLKKHGAESRNDAVNVVLDRAIAEPGKFLCSGPSYPYLHPDTIHTDAAGKRQAGEQLGRAIARRMAGTTNPMLFVSGAVRSGDTITLAIAGAEGALAFDGTVTDPNGARGFQFVQTGGNSVVISGVAISGSNVVITLSATPTGTAQRIIVAGVGSVAASNPSPGPTTGPRCQVRDTATFLGADGGNRYKFLCHQTIDVTT